VRTKSNNFVIIISFPRDCCAALLFGAAIYHFSKYEKGYLKEIRFVILKENINCFKKEFIYRFDNKIENLKKDMNEFGINYYFENLMKKKDKNEIKEDEEETNSNCNSEEVSSSEEEEDIIDTKEINSSTKLNVKFVENNDNIIISPKYSINVKNQLYLEKEPYYISESGYSIYKGIKKFHLF
jgi:hypothetical protein